MDKNYTQTKVESPAEYIMAGEGGVPPGDCIMIEYGPAKVRTENLCRSFKVAKQVNKLGEEQR
jgi:hypothetical protein